VVVERFELVVKEIRVRYIPKAPQLDLRVGIVIGIALARQAIAQPADMQKPTHDLTEQLLIEEWDSEPEDRWRLTFTPYVWATSFTGDVSGAGMTAPVNVNFLDVFHAADSVGSLQGVIRARKGRFGFFMDGSLIYAEENNLRGSVAGVNLEADISLQMGVLEAGTSILAHQRRIGGLETPDPADDRRLYIDLLGGVRGTWLETELDIKGSKTVLLPNGKPVGQIEREFSGSADKSWIDPFVGVGIAAELPRSIVLRSRADVGGFGVGSDLSWQASVAVGWRFNFFQADGVLFTGYRALHQDYRDGGFGIDQTTHGPMVGLLIRF
jgi:hypothetical protein